MMTANLRVYSMNKLRDEDTVGKIKNDHMISDFEIRSMEHVKGTPWTYTVFGVKEVHRVKNATEATDQIVGQYNVRLVETAARKQIRADFSWRVRRTTDGRRARGRTVAKKRAR